ncbi:hypothetical protein [Streptomyces sp. NPDC088736]|uniref:hypothetical protein n=1 Tax=Streptomyces sp. NPDC088736 TaxID=3365881 RepID=UPI0037F95850
MSARDDLYHVIAGVSNDGTRKWCDETRRILDAYRAEVLAEADLLPKADVVAWLTKKAREETPIELLASKAERGAIRPDNLLMLPRAGFFEHGRTYESSGRTFQCLAIDSFPRSGEPRAIGWYATASGGWPSVEALDPDDWERGGWAEVTEGGAS